MGIRLLAIFLGKRNQGEVQILAIIFHETVQKLSGDIRYHFLGSIYMYTSSFDNRICLFLFLCKYILPVLYALAL